MFFLHNADADAVAGAVARFARDVLSVFVVAGLAVSVVHVCVEDVAWYALIGGGWREKASSCPSWLLLVVLRGVAEAEAACTGAARSWRVVFAFTPLAAS